MNSNGKYPQVFFGEQPRRQYDAPSRDTVYVKADSRVRSDGPSTPQVQNHPIFFTANGIVLILGFHQTFCS